MRMRIVSISHSWCVFSCGSHGSDFAVHATFALPVDDCCSAVHLVTVARD